MNFNDAELAALASKTRRIGIFFRLDTDPVVRLWLGFGRINPGVNVFDAGGEVYRGLGELLDVPKYRQLLNGAAERVDFTLSGVSGEVLAKALTDAAQVKGKRAASGFALMGRDWSLLGPVHWTARYVADFLAREQLAADDPFADPVRLVRLSVGTRFTGRRRPAYSYWSDQDQQARYPGDLFFNQVASYAHGFPKSWPVF